MSPEPTSTSPTRQFRINRISFAGHYDIRSSQDQKLYHVSRSSFTRDKPDLTLHEGSDANAPVVAVSHMPKLSGDFMVALGDPADPGAVTWEQMTKENLMASEYRWALNTGQGERRNLVWKRTHSVGVDGMTVSSLTNRSYKLLNRDTDEVLAVFTSERGLRTCGVLQINASWGKDFDVMVFITCLSLYEKARRRAQRASAGG